MRNKFLLLFFVLFFVPVSVFGFSDVSSDESEIYFLNESGVVEGRMPGVYEPDASVNRAEMLKILFEARGVSIDKELFHDCFPDVHSEWFAKYVCYAKSKGFIAGYDDGYFRPAKDVNLAEALKMSFNVYGISLESVDGDWYESFFRTGENYGVFSSLNPDSIVSRKLMAQIASRVAVVNGTFNEYEDSDLKFIRQWGKKVQDLFDDVESSSIKDSLSSIGNDGVKVVQIDDDGFRFFYGDEFFDVKKGGDVLDKDPLIEIRNDGASFGLNADFVFDGDVRFLDVPTLRADVDLSGFYGKSINVVWKLNKSLTVFDKMSSKKMVINLENGAVIGDDSLTHGVSVIDKFPFEVCVSDYDGRNGGIKILSLNSIYIGDCSYYPRLKTVSLGKKISLLKVPGVNPPILPIKPLKRKGDGNKVIVSGDGGKVEFVDEPFIPVIPDPLPPTSSSGGVSGEDVIPAFPVPVQNPGEYDVPSKSASSLEKFLDNFKKSQVNAGKTYEDNKNILSNSIVQLEELMKEYGVDVPSEVPQFDPSVCCPSYAKEGKCCTDLDLNSEAGRKEYIKRINCLVNAFNEKNRELLELINDAFSLMRDVEDLKVAEANFAQLAGYMKLNKIMAHLVIDVVLGDVSDLKGVVSSALSNAFDDVIAGAFDGVIDPSSIFGNYGLFALNRGLSEITDFNNRLKETASLIADKLNLSGVSKDAFIRSVVDRFSDNPRGIFESADWVKLFYDFFVNEGGVGAENFVKSVQKLREKRNANLVDAWKTAQLLKQMNEVLKKVRTEECGKSFVSGVSSEIEKRKSAEKKYKNRFEIDVYYIFSALKWILNYEIYDSIGDDFSSSDVKAKLLEILKKKLCELGYDLCWIDIDFDVEFKKLDGGGFEWKISHYRIKKRKTKKENCECEKSNVNGGGNVVDEDEDVNSGGVNGSGSGDEINEDINDDECNSYEGNVNCVDCSGFIPEEYVGKVRFSEGRFVPEEYESCFFDIPEPVVHNRFVEIFGDDGEDKFVWFIDPVNEGVEFDMGSGEFFRDGVVVDG